MKHYKSLEVLSTFHHQAPSGQTQSPPHINVKPPSKDFLATVLRLRTITQSLMETDRPMTIPTARGQTWQGRSSCSGLAQHVRSWESLACLQLCSGSPVGRWWQPCSYRLAAQWQRSCLQWAPRCSTGVYWVVSHLLRHFCYRALRRATHPVAEHIQRG